MRFLILIIVALLLYSPASFAADYTLYLVRHAEKQSDEKDPQLTRCGMARANQLAEIFTNVDLKAVYSTYYKRTMATALPTAQQKAISIKQYAPNGLEQLVRMLKERQQNALIVGHSNTTPQLLALLSGNKVVPMTEKEYQHLFQVRINQGTASVVKLTQPLRCQ